MFSCPECRSPLIPVAKDRMRCTARLHGAEFDVLFSRYALNPVVTSPPPVVVPTIESAIPLAGVNAIAETTSQCMNHPGVESAGTCGDCGRGICETCSFPQPNQRRLCPTCVAKPTARPVYPVGTGVGSPVLVAMPVGVMCKRHPESAATMNCGHCSTPICGTCQFPGEDGQSYCPDCAMLEPVGPSTGGKSRIVTAIVLATVATLSLVGLLLGVFGSEVQTEEEEMLSGIAVTFFILVPSLIGLAMGVSTFERGRRTLISTWVATIWNGILLGIIVLLIIIGITMG